MFNTGVQFTYLLDSLNTLLFVQHDDLLVVRKNDRPIWTLARFSSPVFADKERLAFVDSSFRATEARVIIEPKPYLKARLEAL